MRQIVKEQTTVLEEGEEMEQSSEKQIWGKWYKDEIEKDNESKREKKNRETVSLKKVTQAKIIKKSIKRTKRRR